MSQVGPVKVEEKIQTHTDVIEGLKRLYKDTIIPLEKACSFQMFHSLPLRDCDFDANPMVLLLGQYSVGKTSFIEFLLGRSYPGQTIGPEPTTDKFVAVFHGEEDNIIPGNAATMQGNLPFQSLERFGSNFLNRFNVATCDSPLLNSITLVDTPGVLSGEQQRLGRAYSFTQVVEWFAMRSDLILLLFDAHKLDVSDEFRSVIDSLRGNEDKVRVILNKADGLDTQNLMRVHGALLWSLSRVFKTPEVVRVYIGSFWKEPLKVTENKNLFEREMKDLLSELGGLPRVCAQRRVNELVKRTKLCRAIGALTSYLRDEMPIFYKDKKKAELIANLSQIYTRLSLQYGFSVGDFPSVAAMQKRLQDLDFMKFQHVPSTMFQQVSKALSQTLPQHLQLLQPSGQDVYVNPFELEAKYGEEWAVTDKDAEKYRQLFLQKAGVDTSQAESIVNEKLYSLKLGGDILRPLFLKSGMTVENLRELWRLADVDKDERLSFVEFIIAMKLLQIAKNNKGKLPLSVPLEFISSARRQYGGEEGAEEEKARQMRLEQMREKQFQKDLEKQVERDQRNNNAAHPPPPVPPPSTTMNSPSSSFRPPPAPPQLPSRREGESKVNIQETYSPLSSASSSPSVAPPPPSSAPPPPAPPSSSTPHHTSSSGVPPPPPSGHHPAYLPPPPSQLKD